LLIGDSNVTFLLNEKSVHGQFATVAEFHEAVGVVMQMRDTARAGGHEVRCDRSLTNAQVTANQVMPQVIQSMPRERRLAWTQWVSRSGPFWLDDREHGEQDWLLLADETEVTNTSIGEAAFCVGNGIERQLISFAPSDWTRSPIEVTWVKEFESQQAIAVQNHTSLQSIALSLDAMPAPFDSWQTLEAFARETCPHLLFSDNAFESLKPHPYHQGAAERLQIRLRVLDRVSNGFDSYGKRTPECEHLLAMHFAGTKAWFTDSSAGEKDEFAKQLLFPHPTRTGEKIICTWHGKVKTPQLRIHFSWPIVANSRVYVPYVGPKLTTR